MSCRTRLQEPIASVTFVEPNPMPVAETIEVKITLSEHSTSTTSDVTDVAKPADGEPTATMPYLLTTSGCRILKRQTSSVRSVPFAVLSQIKFRSLTKVLCNTLLLWFHLVPSSAASESLKSNMFRIYPSEESEFGDEGTSSWRLRGCDSPLPIYRTVRQCHSTRSRNRKKCIL